MRRTAALILICYMLTLSSVLGATTTPSSGEESCRIELKPGDTKVNPVLEKHEAALLILLGFGGFSVVVAILFNVIRKDIRDLSPSMWRYNGIPMEALGGCSGIPMEILHPSSHFNSGIGGSVWFGLAIVMAVLMFPMLSLKLKTHAPGAKTFPQIVYARFGKPAHIVFCCLALFANLVTTTNLLLAGKTTIEVLTKDTNTEFIMLVLAALFGSYCLIGGLGATFYISYFNAALMYLSVTIFILEITYFATPETEAKVSNEAMYEAMSCIIGPEGNYGDSLLTFRSRSGIIFGVVLMFMATSIQFCDQANWQSRIAAKPSQGIIGFLLAGILWFPLPTAISLTASMSYFSLSYQENMTNVLTEDDINNGYITPYVMKSVLGTSGGYLLMSTLMMALMATGSGEVMSVSSILVYDIYKTHINPFRKDLRPSDCILCGKDKISGSCKCRTAMECKSCSDDLALQESGKSNYGYTYTCSEHGMYRHYEDQLLRYKSWIMAIVIVCIIPYGLIISETGINLNWGVMVGPTFTSPFLMPIFLTVWWSKATAKGIVTGGIAGLICCLAGMMIMGSTYEGGLDDFFNNTSKDFSLLAGLGTGVVVSFTLSVVISLCTHNIKTHEDIENEWAKTMNIDNPLHPVRALYRKELDAINAGQTVTSDMMARIFRTPQRVAYVGGAICITIFLIVIPAIALSFEILTQDEFSAWLSTFQIYCIVCTVFVVLCPPIQEALQILNRFKKNKAHREDFTNQHSNVPPFKYDGKPILNDGFKDYTHM